MEITNEIKAKVFAQYLGAKVKTPDHIGTVQNIDGFNYQIGVKYDCLVFTKNAIDGYDKQRSYGKYNITKQAFAFLGSNETEFEMPGGCHLILNPISSITDEDAIEAVKHFGDDPFVFERTRDSIEICFFNRGAISIAYDGVISDVGNGPTKNGFTYFLAYQFLQAKGYDLPQYLLGGATLKEAGLAIYE